MRLRILQVVCKGPRSVNGIVAATGSTQANVSKHLALLAGGGILTRKKGWPVRLLRHEEPTGGETLRIGARATCQVVCPLQRAGLRKGRGQLCPRYADEGRPCSNERGLKAAATERDVHAGAGLGCAAERATPLTGIVSSNRQRTTSAAV
jgi:hypothetical protein